MARKNPTLTQRERLISKNAFRCCVCKREGIGLHLHHIDGNSSNTVDENIAVLCVEDHDHHHRPNKYTKAKHLELSAEKLLEYKNSWEKFIKNASSNNPSVIAVINVYGNFEQLHAARIVFQWPNEKIEFERTFHLLEGNIDYWTDEMISEVQSIGKNVKLTLIDEPLPIDYCTCCGSAYSNTVKEGFVVKATDPSWDTKSLMSIYINPVNPSLAISISLLEKHTFSAHLHLCKGTHLHFTSDYYNERIKIKKIPSVRTQATKICEKVISDWEPAHILIGTGDHDNPEIIDDFLLPRVWEKRSSKKAM
jgi:hypothetical protein